MIPMTDPDALAVPSAVSWAAPLAAIVLFALLAALVVSRAARRSTLPDARLRALDQRLGAVEARLTRLERDLDALGDIVGEKIEAMTTTLQTVTRGIDRIEDFLLKAAGDALVKTKNGDDR